MTTKADPPRDLLTILRDGVLVERALQKAARQAIHEHKKEGLPLAMWRDGKVVWVPAEELEAQVGKP